MSVDDGGTMALALGDEKPLVTFEGESEANRIVQAIWAPTKNGKSKQSI